MSRSPPNLLVSKAYMGEHVAAQCGPQPEQISFLVPRFCRTYYGKRTTNKNRTIIVRPVPLSAII